MARMIYADPFGSYTTGYREGQEDELNLGRYNIGARAAQQDWDVRQQQYELDKILNPLRVSTAKDAALTSSVGAGALATRAFGDPAAMARAFPYLPEGYRLEGGNVIGPSGTVMPQTDLQTGALYGFAALDPNQRGQMGAAGRGAGGVTDFYGIPPINPQVSTPGAGQPAAAAPQPTPASRVPPAEPSNWQRAAQFVLDNPVVTSLIGGPAGAGIAALGAGAQAATAQPATTPQYMVDPNTGQILTVTPPPSSAPPIGLYGDLLRQLIQQAPQAAQALQNAQPIVDMASGRTAPPSLPDMKPDDLASLLYGIETGGERNPYTARNPTSSAAGRGQWITSTWGNYGGYPSADLAPPEIQDRRIAEDTQRYLEAAGGNPLVATAMHLAPSYASNVNEWDRVLNSQGETIRKYLSRKFDPALVEQYINYARQ